MEKESVDNAKFLNLSKEVQYYKKNIKRIDLRTKNDKRRKDNMQPLSR